MANWPSDRLYIKKKSTLGLLLQNNRFFT